ncbi:MAG: SxtJ family membrane protein [Gemmataceae bacterium]
MTWKDIPRNPSPTTLRQFAALWLVVFGALGALHFPELGGKVLLALAGLVGVPGLIQPTLLRPLFVGWMIAVFPIGWTVSHVMLALLFFGLFTPLALWFRVRGRDALWLRRRLMTTYWQPKPAVASVTRYYKQF